jgi:hypothetical protein
MSSTVISLRLDPELIARIDQRAAQAGEARTEYILRWLPCYYDTDDPRRGSESRAGGAD